MYIYICYRCAARARADGGRPAMSALSVRVSLKALVASSRLLEKAVEASARARRLALKVSCKKINRSHTHTPTEDGKKYTAG